MQTIVLNPSVLTWPWRATRASLPAAPDFLASPAEFRSWLADRRGSPYAGRADSDRHCPIANWLRARGMPARVSAPYVVFAGDRAVASPRWVEEFVEAVDLLEGPVSKARAASILDEILAGRDGEGRHDEVVLVGVTPLDVPVPAGVGR